VQATTIKKRVRDDGYAVTTYTSTNRHLQTIIHSLYSTSNTPLRAISIAGKR